MTELVILDGSTFYVGDEIGDAHPHLTHGLFFEDVRHLGLWQLLIDDAPLRLLTSANLTYYAARTFGTLGSADVNFQPSLVVRRDLVVTDRLHEDVIVENHSNEEREVTLTYRFQADFADLFEVKDGIDVEAPVLATLRESEAEFEFELDGFLRRTLIHFGQQCQIAENRADIHLSLAPRERWRVCVDVVPLTTRLETPHDVCTVDLASRGQLRPIMPLTLDEWLDEAPSIETSSDSLRRLYRQSLIDLASLRFRPHERLAWSLPAAGLPWFMTLFGRDSLITSFQSLPFVPRLARTTLEALAELQAGGHDDFRDAEPGKILHELRRGKHASLGISPHSPYYGSHDATPLFLILLDEYERWTADAAFVRRMEKPARRALEWLERYGDLDGDGYLEYLTRSPVGLRNQGWKDSGDAIRFSNGAIAEPPIGTCELQGYAYAAKIRVARLARDFWGDSTLAERLEADADQLRRRFNEDFWLEDKGIYGLALDRDKRVVDSMTSNVGHLLWCGILDERRGARVMETLLGPEMNSGWGIRTLTTAAAGYNPISYHNGSVWPHDTAIVAEGLRLYGFRSEASSLAAGIIETAPYFDFQLPELLAGLARDDTGIPVAYPAASRPQAWAAGASLMALRTLLGLDAFDEGLAIHPGVPERIGSIALRHVPFRSGRVDVVSE